MCYEALQFVPAGGGGGGGYVIYWEVGKVYKLVEHISESREHITRPRKSGNLVSLGYVSYSKQSLN
jgi:hypothetical protein